VWLPHWPGIVLEASTDPVIGVYPPRRANSQTSTCDLIGKVQGLTHDLADENSHDVGLLGEPQLKPLSANIAPPRMLTKSGTQDKRNKGTPEPSGCMFACEKPSGWCIRLHGVWWIGK
jgi:hypothetical protein